MFSEPVNETVSGDVNGDVSGDVNGDVNSNVNDTLNENETLILNLLIANEKITKKEIFEQLNIAPRTIDRAIKKLKDLNLIERVGSDKTGHWIVK